MKNYLLTIENIYSILFKSKRHDFWESDEGWTSRENSDLFMIAGSTYENIDDLHEDIRFEALPLVLSNRPATGPFNWKIESSDIGNAYIIWDEADPFTDQENPRNFDLLFRKVR